MDILLLNVIVLITCGILVAGYLLIYRPLNTLLKKSIMLEKEVVRLSDILTLNAKHTSVLKQRIDAIFVTEKDPPSPNTATKVDEDTIELTEENPLDLPKGVKLQVEGGDTVTPFNMNNG